ncbi:MAG: hypothetical protein JWN31_1830 [Frankiales bacterium]|nr:hypothetical protein [Frankiales bacterium]
MQPSRRQLLSGAAVGLAAACTPDKPVAKTPSKDDRLREEAAIREEALLRLYAAALIAFPALTAELQPLQAQHVEHRTALGAQPLPSAITRADPRLLGRTPAEARRNLAALEKGTADGHAAAVPSAGRPLAQVLASLSACEAAHAEALR